ncbi:hypothetical protein E1J29_11560 [Xanthomonas hortorum pv. vitians]|nr:hypothetical protein [Xanthomonas hortorum pv. vitians]NMI43962.1 hypothetical protein [Xanthomonas hortorum pv. vitians]
MSCLSRSVVPSAAARPAAIKLTAVSPELKHAACQNAVPVFRRGDQRVGDGADAVRPAQAEDFKSMD